MFAAPPQIEELISPGLPPWTGASPHRASFSASGAIFRSILPTSFSTSSPSSGCVIIFVALCLQHQHVPQPTELAA